MQLIAVAPRERARYSLSMGAYLLLVLAGFLGGAMNAVAGGGSFVTFPALVAAGVPSVAANASSTVALFPGGLASVYAYRKDPMGFEGVSLRGLMGMSFVGGLAGAILLLATPTPAFDVIVPWLLLVATLTFTWGAKAGVWMRRFVRVGGRELLAIQFILSIYAGYFGGGVGIMTMAAWSLLISADIRRMSPTRILMVTVGNGAAVLWFVARGGVRWPETLCVLAGAVGGGYLGARIARRAPPKVLRAIIVATAWIMTAVFFVRAF